MLFFRYLVVRVVYRHTDRRSEVFHAFDPVPVSADKTRKRQPTLEKARMWFQLHKTKVIHYYRTLQHGKKLYIVLVYVLHRNGSRLYEFIAFPLPTWTGWLLLVSIS